MNKKVIYLVRYFANPDWNKLSWRKNSELADSWTGKKIYPRLEQFRCLAPFIHRYAERIGADVKVIEPKLKQDFFWEWEGNDLHHFFSKLECFIHFKDSDYDKMLYIDGDVLINNSALDIFNEVEDGFAYAPAMFPRKARMYVRWHQMCFGARPLKPMMNGGVIVCAGRDNASSFLNFFKSKEFKSIVMDKRWKKIFPKLGNDQPIFSAFMEQSKIKVTILDRTWNKYYEEAESSDYFLHFCGHGKQRIQEEVDKLTN